MGCLLKRRKESVCVRSDEKIEAENEGWVVAVEGEGSWRESVYIHFSPHYRALWHLVCHQHYAQDAHRTFSTLQQNMDKRAASALDNLTTVGP